MLILLIFSGGVLSRNCSVMVLSSAFCTTASKKFRSEGASMNCMKTGVAGFRLRIAWSSVGCLPVDFEPDFGVPCVARVNLL